MKGRTDEEWLADRRRADREEALADLCAFVGRGLGHTSPTIPT
jgi:hypothetical protein